MARGDGSENGLQLREKSAFDIFWATYTRIMGCSEVSVNICSFYFLIFHLWPFTKCIITI